MRLVSPVFLGYFSSVVIGLKILEDSLDKLKDDQKSQ